MTDPSFIYDERDRMDEELEQREPPLDWASYDPMLTEAEIAELAEAVDRYRPQVEFDQEAHRARLAERLAAGASVPFSLFM
ncbi:MAG: hypothetical protein H8D74_00905 [Chloroflexi bacterium]|nr:hypothetical protein [Chloroflexota bacterium]